MSFLLAYIFQNFSLFLNQNKLSMNKVCGIQEWFKSPRTNINFFCEVLGSWLRVQCFRMKKEELSVLGKLYFLFPNTSIIQQHRCYHLVPISEVKRYWTTSSRLCMILHLTSGHHIRAAMLLKGACVRKQKVLCGRQFASSFTLKYEFC